MDQYGRLRNPCHRHLPLLISALLPTYIYVKVTSWSHWIKPCVRFVTQIASHCKNTMMNLIQSLLVMRNTTQSPSKVNLMLPSTVLKPAYVDNSSLWHVPRETLSIFPTAVRSHVVVCLVCWQDREYCDSLGLPCVSLEEFCVVYAHSTTLVPNIACAKGSLAALHEFSPVDRKLISHHFTRLAINPVQQTIGQYLSCPLPLGFWRKLCSSRVCSFLDEHNLMPKHQSAYRKSHSTEDALVLAANRWLLSKYARKSTGIVFVDMSKAFDSVRHSFLIEDLFQLRVSEVCLDWFINYLSDCVQRIVGSQYSGYTVHTKGSVLGPLLFTLYMRNLDDHLSSCVFSQQFADDIIIEVASLDPQHVIASLSGAMTDLATWLNNWGLRVNEKKTQELLLPPRGKLPPSDLTDLVTSREKALQTVHEAKYLGIIVLCQ